MDCPAPESLLRLMESQPAPRADLLRRHLDDCVDCQRALAAAILADDQYRAEGPRVRLGSVIADRYHLDALVGHGAMGQVYAAWDRRLDRTVALKTVRTPGGRDRTARIPRLIRESKAMARLRHPNVVTVYDAGEWNGEAYVVMELVKGVTLRDWVDTMPDWRQRLRILCAAGRGLSAAHEAGFVHRDFKPDNVFVDDTGGVFVGDFGLVRVAEGGTPLTVDHDGDGGAHGSDAADRQSLTLTDGVVGTLGYMAPEQMRGRALGVEADIFSFCVTAFEVLFGERPFRGDTVESLLNSIVGDDVRSAPPRSSVPSRVRRALRRGLASAPEGRPASMAGLLAELESASRPRRASVQKIGLVAVGGALVGAGVVSAAQSPPVPDCDPETTLAWDEQISGEFVDNLTGALSGQRAARARASLDEYAAAWSQAWPEACRLPPERGQLARSCLDGRGRGFSAVVGLASVDAAMAERGVLRLRSIEGCTADAQALEQPLPADSELRSEVLPLRADLEEVRMLQDVGRWQAVHPRVEALVERAQRVGDPAMVAATLFARGMGESRLGLDGAHETLQEVVRTAVAASYDVLAARAWIQMVSNARLHLRDYGRAHEYAGHAGAVIDRLEGTIDTGTLRAKLLAEQGLTYNDEGELEKASALLQRALPQAEEDNTELAEAVREALALVLANQGQLEPAIAMHREIVAWRSRHLAADHPAIGRAHLNLGATLYEADRPQEGLVEANRAYEVLVRAFGTNHPDVHSAVFSAAQCMVELERLAEAEEVFRRLEAEVDNDGEGRRLLTLVLSDHAYLAVHDGRVDEGIALSQRAGELYTEAEANTLQYVEHLVTHSELLLDAGRTREGLVAARDALGAVRAQTERQPALVAVTEHVLGRAQWMNGLPEQSIRTLRSAIEHHEELGEPRGLDVATRGVLARALWDVGRRDEARTLARYAYATMARDHDTQGEELAAWAAAVGLELAAPERPPAP